MPVLKNPRHEAFAQAIFHGLAQGFSQGECYLQAGYGGERKDKDAARFHASRLLHRYKVIDRVRELQDQAAKRKGVTVDSILSELEEARTVSRDQKQGSAMTAATMGKAKIAGLDIQRTEIGVPGDFNNVNSKLELAEQYLATEYGVTEITDEMRNAAVEELKRHSAAMDVIARAGPKSVLN